MRKKSTINKKRLTILVNDKITDMIQDIIKIMPTCDNMTAVIIRAVDEMHTQRVRGLTLDGRKLRGDARALAPKDICDQLRGTIEDGVCTYLSYELAMDKVNKYTTKLPLDFLTENMIERQYYPSKEECLKHVENGDINSLKD